MFRQIGSALSSSLYSSPLKASSMNRPGMKKGTSHAGLRNMHTFLCICRLGYCKTHSARPWPNPITTTCLEGSTYVNLCLRTYFHSHQHNHKHHTTPHTHVVASAVRRSSTTQARTVTWCSRASYSLVWTRMTPRPSTTL